MNNNQAKNSPSGKNTKPRAPQAKGASLNAATKKESRTVGQLLLCLKPSYLFERSKISLVLKLWISLEFLRKRYFDLRSEQLRLR